MRRTIERIRTVIREGRLQRQTPDSIVHAVRSTDAFAELLGRGDRPMLAGMQASPLGRRLLEERPDVLALVADRDRLRSMPDGSLGREYCRFAEENGLHPEKLAADVREARAPTGGFVPNASPELAWLHDRYRDLHDLRHVLSGYGTDMAGEWGIIAFETRQVGYRSLALLTFLHMTWRVLTTGRFDLLRLWFEGRRRDARARFLLAQDWEALMPRPIEEVRRELGITPGRPYRPWSLPGQPTGAVVRV